MKKRYLCVYNPESGKGATDERQLKGLFKDNSVEIDFIDIKDGLSKAKEMVKAKRHTALIAAGGDGTVNLAASWALKLELPLGIVPSGTLNHFAKDAGIPMDGREAAATILKGNLVKVDYCTVNGHVFINNSSIGFYPSTVLWRENNKLRYGKWVIAAIASLKVLSRHRRLSLRVRTEEQNRNLKTPLLFVGNNIYKLDKRGPANRTNINTGKIFVYAVRSTGPLSFVGRALLLIFGTGGHEKDFCIDTKGPIAITLKKDKVNVSLDGEVISTTVPLNYQIHPTGLSVYLP